MSKQLATAIHLTDESGVVHSFLAGQTPPKWARKLITNPKAWAEADDADAAESTDEDATDAGEGAADGGEGSTESAESEDSDDSETPVDVPIPPKAGEGSGVQAWRAYADAKGFETDDDISRDEIISALAADGIPTE